MGERMDKKSLVRLVREIDCTHLRAEAGVSQWLLRCGRSGAHTDDVHCQLCRQRKSLQIGAK